MYLKNLLSIKEKPFYAEYIIIDDKMIDQPIIDNGEVFIIINFGVFNELCDLVERQKIIQVIIISKNDHILMNTQIILNSIEADHTNKIYRLTFEELMWWKASPRLEDINIRHNPMYEKRKYGK